MHAAKRAAFDVEQNNAAPPKSLMFDESRLSETHNHDDHKQAQVPAEPPATEKLNPHARRLLISDSIIAL